jgi:hypothetical protein
VSDPRGAARTFLVTKQKPSRSANRVDASRGLTNGCEPGHANGCERSHPDGHGQDQAVGGGATPHDFDFAPAVLSRAASDDVSGTFVVGTAPSTAVCTTRETYAEAARDGGSAARSRLRRIALRANGSADAPAERTADEAPEIPPGAEPLPVDGAEFVEAVHERVDLIALEVRLLRSLDEKIVQRELAYLRELRYGKVAAPLEDEGQRVVFNLPRPDRRAGSEDS